jgi:hypothetical protein
MSSVPYIFVNRSGNIPLSELDSNFSNVKAQVDSANVVSDAAQPAITSVGTLTALTVAGNIAVTTGVFKSSTSTTVLAGGANNYTQLQWAADVSNPGTGQNQYLRLDTNGAQIKTSSSNYTWQFSTDGTTDMPGNLDVTGNVALTGSIVVGANLAVTGNAQITGIFAVGSYTKATLNTITGSSGSMAAVLNSPSHQGRIAYWDLTFNRWSYIDTNDPV